MKRADDDLRLETRVVILDNDRGPLVDVVEIPYPATVGAQLEHRGRSWRVFGQRERTRVLLASECCTDHPPCLPA